MKLIAQDLPRTFPNYSFFKKGAPLCGPLRQILEALVCFRPDMGYIQGMSYVGAMLLLYMDTYTAFQCLVNLLDTYVYISYIGNGDKLNRFFGLFDGAFKIELPKLHSHFKNEGVRGDMYLLDWFITLFLKPLPLHMSARIVDNYFLHGDVFIWRTALGILHVLNKDLMKMDFEGIIKSLKNLKDIDEKRLFECIATVRFDKTYFASVMQALRHDDTPSGLSKSY